MLTELIQMTPRSMAIIKIKLTSINRFSDLVIFASSGRKQIHDATFEASKIYATTVFHGNKEHGKHVLITLNKTPLLIMIQRCTDLLQTSRKNVKY
jgi:hypothetical protein